MKKLGIPAIIVGAPSNLIRHPPVKIYAPGCGHHPPNTALENVSKVLYIKKHFARSMTVTALNQAVGQGPYGGRIFRVWFS